MASRTLRARRDPGRENSGRVSGPELNYVAAPTCKSVHLAKVLNTFTIPISVNLNCKDFAVDRKPPYTSLEISHN
jgi:hypothetical protein